MRITVNGKETDCPEQTTLAGLLRGLELDSRSVVVEHNRTIVPHAEWERVALAEGDRLELVRLVGGG